MLAKKGKGKSKNMSIQFLEKYSYDLPFDKGPQEGFVPVIANLVDLPYDKQVAEQKKCDAIYMKLRIVVTSVVTVVRLGVMLIYEEETEEYRHILEQWANAKYKQVMDKFNKWDVLDRTPELYEHAWNEADNFLHVFVDTIMKKFGMSVLLLLTGPLGSEQGKVMIQSAHFNNVGSMTSLIWPKFNKQGFRAVQDSIIQYEEAVFFKLSKPNNMMNFKMPVTLKQPQEEFTSLLDSDLNWPNPLNWGDTTNQQQPLWNNSHAAPYGVPFHAQVFINGTSILMNPILPVAAMPAMPSMLAALSILTTPGWTLTNPALLTPTLTTPGGLLTNSALPVSATPTQTLTTPGVH
ncbi:hypothetical protein BDN71DRAFT_1435667 [Pleurotus eryngii]|uniref:Uncharacterized protein n=1 Tax=Pleurotus eryngii TaxID=5323 RepID=A0A9P5ZML5_PLEER|nr:hypothetical protein BDN71DRAFT_1435667 [Pleurotus eryngii]